jgi:hypothetical protein
MVQVAGPGPRARSIRVISLRMVEVASAAVGTQLVTVIARPSELARCRWRDSAGEITVANRARLWTAKGELGLDHNETRSFRDRNHHVRTGARQLEGAHCWRVTELLATEFVYSSVGNVCAPISGGGTYVVGIRNAAI